MKKYIFQNNPVLNIFEELFRQNVIVYLQVAYSLFLIWKYILPTIIQQFIVLVQNNQKNQLYKLYISSIWKLKFMFHTIGYQKNCPNSITDWQGNVGNSKQNSSLKKEKLQQLQMRIPVAYKIVIAVCFVIGYTIYRTSYVKFDNSKCLQDIYLDATSNANRLLRQGDNTIVGIGQVMMDTSVVFMTVAWIILVKNSRMTMSPVLVLLLRTLFVTIDKFPFDEYFIWNSPGFLSLTVPYFRSRDYYFSGHTANLSILMFEMFTLRWYWVGAFTLLNLLYIMHMTIITRVHYNIDLIGGVIFAVLCYRLSILWIKQFDYLLSIPFYLVRIVYYKIRKYDQRKEYEPIYAPQTERTVKYYANHAF